MMTINEILCRKVSYQENAWSALSKEVSIGEMLNSIKNGRYASEIKRLRAFLDDGDKEEYDSFKRRLPGVTFGATFNKQRKREDLKVYNYVAVIDIDKLSSEELRTLKTVLSSEQYVSCYWESPSKRGIKGLIQLSHNVHVNDYNMSLFHKRAFTTIVEHFSRSYGVDLDTSGSDVTRLCFVSYDPDLVLKDSFEPFPVKEVGLADQERKKSAKEELKPAKPIKHVHKTEKDILLNPEGKNAPQDRMTIKSIIKFLTKRNKSITHSYTNWYRVAFAIANTFTHDIGEEYFLRLCRLDGIKHDEIESRNLLRYCYETSKKEISFKTIVYLARDTGFKVLGGSEGGYPKDSRAY